MTTEMSMVIDGLKYYANKLAQEAEALDRVGACPRTVARLRDWHDRLMQYHRSLHEIESKRLDTELAKARESAGAILKAFVEKTKEKP